MLSSRPQTLLLLPWLLCPIAWFSAMGALPYHFQSWQTDDGLPHNSVHALAQSADGYLWVGTRAGLARFDGLQFTAVEDASAPELQHAWVTALAQGRDGSLWIGTDQGGLFRRLGGVFSHFSAGERLPSNQIHCLLEDKDGILWAGTEGGLARYGDGRFTVYTDAQGLGDNSVRALWQDRQGVLRIATKRGLSSLGTDGKMATKDFAGGWIANALRAVCEDRQGVVWVGSTEGLTASPRLGSTALPGNTIVYGLKEGLPDPVVNVVYEDSAGQLWVGTYAGLVRMEAGKMIGLAGPDELSDLVYTIFEDREQNLWVGARDGLYRLSPARFTTYTTQQGLSGNNVMSVCEDRSGALWFGIWGGGVSALRDGKIQNYTRSTGLQRDSVLSLGEARDGTILVGMDFEAGLDQMKDGRRVSFPKPKGLTAAPIRVIHEDCQGTLWVGTRRGLDAIRDGQVQVYTTSNGLAGDDVLSLCEAADGTLWVGTENGLSHLHAGRFQSFTVRDGLADNAILALYEDRDRTLWIGTRNGGLNRLRDGKFVGYSTRQGLFSDEIYEILEDDFGYFWMSCRRGIFRVAKKELEDYSQGRIRSLTATAFGKADGLLSVQCNGVAKPAGWKARDGRLWFPTIHGAVAVESSIKSNEKPPPVAIEDVLADRRPVQSRAGVPPGPITPQQTLASSAPTLGQAGRLPYVVRIPPGRGELEIRYTALSLQAPGKNRFRYQLEGVDLDWNDAGYERAARYNHLAPGRYRFRVIACNNDGVWNETGAELGLLVLPHYWETWWFRTTIAAGMVVLLAALYRLRVSRLRGLEQLRIQIAANLHDDVGAQLTKVAMITELVDRRTESANPMKPHIESIFDTTRQVIQAMDEVVWTINPKNDTLENLANYIFRYTQDYFQNTGTRCRLDFPTQLPERGVPTEVRHNLFMAVKEALNNALKHAKATEVRVGLALADGKINITIADDGRGFEPKTADPSGNGLRNMRERLEAIGGRLVLESRPGAGTTITMEIDAG